MKGPKETLQDSLTTKGGKGTKAKKSPPGGKVLQRLILFAGERDLPLPIDTGVSAVKSSTKGKKKSAASRGTKADEAKTKEYVKAFTDAAAKLHTDDNIAGVVETSSAKGTSKSPPTGIGPQWRFLGPTMMSNGQTYGESRVIVSGRIAAVAVNPSNANHILCGSAGGGVWETRNRGATWSPRTDYMPTLTVGALAFNPLSPTIVYCGTGEGNFYAGLGAGLLRSTDGGTTWAIHATTPFVGQGFYDLIVDRANPNHLLSANSWGVYESTNGGTAWTARRTSQCWDLAMRHTGGPTAEVLAACRDGLFRSTNGGSTYTRVNLPGGPAAFDRLACDISRTNPAVAYAFGSSGGVGYLYHRNAAGTWARLVNPPGLNVGQAWYDWFLAVSPDADTQIYLGAIEAYRGTFSGGAWTWVTISNKAGDDIHPDQHSITFDPTNANIIYIGNDGGLFTSPNRGMNWTSLNNGLGITEIEYMAHDFGSSRWILAGTQDNGSIRYTGNPAWDHVADGDGGDCGVNRAAPDVVFHTYYGMGMERSNTKGNWGSFGWIGPNVGAGYNALFYPPMEVNNDTVAQAGQSVYISRNRGTNWSQVNLPAGSGVGSAMYIPNPNTVFVGTNNGRLFRITWSGTAWSAATALTTPRAGAFISDIHVNPANLNRIWVTSSSMGGNRVFRSDNGGTAWVNCTAGLPNLPISSVEVHPGNANRVWVAADVGVYQSFNAGATWTAFANGLPNALAVDLLYHPHARVLRVGMRNRGVWEIPVDGWLTIPICAVQWNGVLNPNQTQKWFTFNWPASWHVIWTIMPTNPRPGAPQVTWNVEVERAGEYVTYWIQVTNLTNQVANFEGRYAILSYY